MNNLIDPNQEPWLIFLVVLVTLVCALCTALLVPLRQRFSRIDPKYFRRVRVRFPSFLFAGIGSRQGTGNVREYGVIVPMFVLHVLGYLFTVAICVAVPVLYYRYGVDLTELWAAPVAITLVHTVAVVATEASVLRVSRKKAAEQAQQQ